MKALEKELATYHAKLPELQQEEGKYVLIKGDEVVSIWETYGDAMKEGYEHFRLEPFLVKKIEQVEQVFYFSRDLAPCRP